MKVILSTSVAEDPGPFLGIVRLIGNICNCPRISPRMQPPTTSSRIINHRHPSAGHDRLNFVVHGARGSDLKQYDGVGELLGFPPGISIE
ncbi:hypothetical protein GOBAR_DD22766 [Gossypium barbadense]|nr:hypothetical protein GOBAR_DD22766 [Gossypium barbadense]